MSASLWRAASEPQDYEEPDPPHPNDRARCWRGHFLKMPVQNRGWVEEWTTEEDGSHSPGWRAARDGEMADEVEIFCPTCNAWGQL